jgi:hypothetical protein
MDQNNQNQNKENPFSQPLKLNSEGVDNGSDQSKNPPRKKNASSLFKSGWFKKIGLGLAVVIVLTGIYFLFFYQATVTINIEPPNASISLDGQKIEKNFVAKPGTHELSVGAEGYLSYNKEIEINYFSNQPIEVSLQKSPQFTVLDGVKNLDQGAISNLDYNEEKNTLFYLKNEACWRLNLNHKKPQPEKISPSIFKNVRRLIWSKDNLGAVLQIDNPRELKGTKFYRETSQTTTWFYDFKRYDLLNQVAHYWGKGIGGIGMAPDQERVGHFFSTLSPETSLVISNLRRNDVSRVARISKYQNPYISWQPNRRYILIVKDNLITGFDTYLDSLIDISEGSFEMAQVIPSGEKILYLSPTYGVDKPASIMDLNGEEKENLNFNFRFNNIDWVGDDRFCGVGSKENSSLAFCYNIGEALEEMAWPKTDSSNITETEVSFDDKKFFLIKSGQLVSLDIITKNY